jgi:hypothetical protein
MEVEGRGQKLQKAKKKLVTIIQTNTKIGFSLNILTTLSTPLPRIFSEPQRN